MNLLYILLILALWSSNSSDAWDNDYLTTTDSPDQLNATTTSMTSMTDCRPFLIYNKDHHKCVKAVSTVVVQMESCDVSSADQHFQWISSTQIISLSFGLCLGAEKIKNTVKVILLPCNKLDPVQTWECKDETLFGLKGQSLHLNYGHRTDSNVMLFNGTSEWSRWLIYGTKENLCSRRYEEYTIGGNSCGKPCQFPFRYADKWYIDCTTDGSRDGRLWCSTETDFNTARKWGFCPSKISDLPVPNITVFGQMEDRDHVIVMCSFGRILIDSSFQLLLDGEHNHTQMNPLCYSNAVCVFDVKVSPPVSFTCVHKIHFAMNQTESFTYSLSDFPAVVEHHEDGKSSFFIGFLSFLAVGLTVVIVTLIALKIRNKTEVPTMRFTNE